MFDQDPNECAPISGAEFAQMCDEMAALRARIAELEGTAVAVLPNNIRRWALDIRRGEMFEIAKGAYALIKDIQPIRADRVLGEGQVAVDRDELEALRKSHAEWTALHLSMNPVNRMVNSEHVTNLHRVRQLVDLAKRLGFASAKLVVGDEANDDRIGESGDDALDAVACNYGPDESFDVWYAIDGLGGDECVGVQSDDPPYYAIRAQAKGVGE